MYESDWLGGNLAVCSTLHFPVSHMQLYTPGFQYKNEIDAGAMATPSVAQQQSAGRECLPHVSCAGNVVSAEGLASRDKLPCSAVCL